MPPPTTSTPVLESLYERFVNEEDARICKDIPDEACREAPTNFPLIVGSKTLTQLGDALANPKTVLAWLMNSVGAPAYLLGLLVPIRESGSLIPQLVIAAWVRREPIRKGLWVIGSLLQCAAVVGMGLSALLLGSAGGWGVIVCLGGFSLARGLCSVAHKDVLGKTIPKSRRGRVSGLASGVSGVLVLGVGFGILTFSDRPDTGFYMALLAAAGALWLLAALLYSRIRELPGETAGGGNALSEAFDRLGLLLTDTSFRRFVLTRALLLGAPLAAPFYVTLGQRASEGTSQMLGLFIVAGGLASSLSAPFWGRMADLSSRRVLLLAGLIAGLLGIAVFTIEQLLGAGSVWIYAGAFFLLSIAHSGIRLGRKTYLVDMASGNRRTDYVAVSNSVIGVLLLLAGLITALASSAGPEMIILGLSLCTLLGVLFGTRLPEVES